MSADANITLVRCFDGIEQHLRVASMEPAGDIGGTDQVQYGIVVAHGPVAEAFAEVAVEVDVQGRGFGCGTHRGCLS